MFMIYVCVCVCVCVYVHGRINTMWFLTNELVYKSSINVMESMLDHQAKGKHLVIISKCVRFFAMTGDNLSFPPHTHAHMHMHTYLIYQY